MEQVKTLSRKIKAAEARRLPISLTRVSHYMRAHLAVIYKPRSQVSYAVMFNLSEIGIVFWRYGGVATHGLVPTVCVDEAGQQINVKRHVNHHPLTPSITPPGCWPSITRFIFLPPPAGLPAGAARLPGREVTARGRPNVITGTAEASFSCCIHSFIQSFIQPFTKRIKDVDFCFFYECNNVIL